MTTDHDWKTWGEKDPYFGVLSHEKFHDGNNRDEFFLSGEKWVTKSLLQYEKFFGPVNKGSVLDFGSGVGRLSLAFSRHFERVVGLDISPAMISEAQQNAKILRRDNTVFALSDSDLTGAPGQFDFVSSYIVLQHISADRGVKIIRNLLEKVKLGGGCIIHVSIRRQTSIIRMLAYWVRIHVPLGNTVLNFLLKRSNHGPAMQMNVYHVPTLLSIFNEFGMSDILLETEDHSGVMTAIMMSRRPSSES